MEPTDVVDSPSGGRNRSDIEVLLFHVTEADGVSRDEEFAYLATVGLSESKAVRRPDAERVELVVRVDGHRTHGDLKKLARALRGLAEEWVDEQTELAPGTMVEGISLPPFDEMHAALIGDWGGSKTRLTVNPDVLLLTPYPLFESEVEAARQLGPDKTKQAFDRKRVNLHDPNRRAVKLRGQPGGSRKRRATAARPSGSIRSVRKSWKDIEAWYEDKVPEMFKRLKPGASAAEIERFAKEVKVDLPRDYVESLKIHDGQVDLGEYTYLSIDGALKNWRRKQTLLKKATSGGAERVKGRGEAKMREVWWDRGWIPFAEDSAGNLLCLDMAPEPDGTTAQVLSVDVEDGPSLTGDESFAEWLESFRDDLHDDKYKIDAGGWLVPR